MNPLEDMLKELSIDMELDKPLELDTYGRCLLVANEKCRIQVELDQTGEECLIVSEIVTIPPGKFRENVFKTALKANQINHAFILAWLEPKQQLILFERWPLKYLNREKNLERFKELLEISLTWREEIDKGILPNFILP